MFSRMSVRKPYTVIVGIIMVIVLGVIAFQRMSTDLLPRMNLPYVVVYTTYPGASPEVVETELTRPMESSFATLTDIKKLTSQSRDNVSVVILQFNDGANMDTALIEISSKLDQLKGAWDDDVGSPVALKLNPDMLPVTILSVTRDDMDILQLSDYVTDELVPEFEGLNGVASATASGVITQEIDVTIEQSRIDVINSLILKDVSRQLAKVEKQLDESQDQLSEGKRELARQKKETYGQLDQAEAALEAGESQLSGAIEDMERRKSALEAERNALASDILEMESALSLSDAQIGVVEEAADRLAALKAQREALQQQLTRLQEGSENTPLVLKRQELQTQRDTLAAERDIQTAYLQDIETLDPQGLNAEISRLNDEIDTAETTLGVAESELARAVRRRDTLKAEADDLTARLADMGQEQPSPEMPAPPSDEPVSELTETPVEDEPTLELTEPTGEEPAQEEPVTEEPVVEEPTQEEPTAEEPTEEEPATEEPVVEEPTQEEPAAEEPAAEEPTQEEPAQEEPVQEEPTAEEPAQEEPANEEEPAEEPEEPADEEEPSDNEDDEDDVDDGDEAEALPEADEAELAWLSWLSAHAEEATEQELRARLEATQAQLQTLEAEVTRREARVAELREQAESLREQRDARQRALDAMVDGGEDATARREEAEARVAALDERIAALDAEVAEIDAQMSEADAEAKALAQQIADLDGQIGALEDFRVDHTLDLLADPNGLTSKYAKAKAELSQMDSGLKTLDSTLEKLQKGILPGGYLPGMDDDTKIAEAKQQLAASRAQADAAFDEAETQILDGEEALAKARREFRKQRKKAFEKAGLDDVITVQMVAGLLGAQNMSMPAGYVKKVDEDRVLVRVGDKFKSLDELKHTKLFTMDLKHVKEVRLLDVATVTLADDRDDVFTKLDGQDGVLLSLEKQSTFSTADVADTIMKKVAELQQARPELHIVDLMNQGEYIDVVVSSVLDNLISGGGLAVLVLLLFLLDWRPTLTVAFSIPVSVVIAFVGMYFTGITLNVLSLSGLSLGIGMLVDNSIVSIENIYRLHDEEGYPPLKACVEGVSSVSGALFSSTLTTICVFLPIVFVQGTARDLFADMGLTIAYSLLASLLVAMTVVPMMSSFLMRRTKPRKHRIFGAIQAVYAGILKAALKLKLLVLLAAVGMLVFSGMQVSKMAISFMPEVNSRQMSADLAPDSDMTQDEQQAQAMQVMDEMLKIKGIQSVGLMQGGGTMLSSGAGGDFSYYITVDQDAGVDNVDIARQIDQIGERLGADLTASSSTMDISSMSGSGIQVRITGDELDTLQAIAKDVADIARQTEGVDDVDDGMEEAVDELRVTVNKEKVIDNSLTTGQVLQFLAQKLTEKTEITKITLDGKEMKVQLIDARDRGIRPNDIEDLEIKVEKEEKDTMVRIGDIADITDATALSTIHRNDQKRSISVSFTVKDGYGANLVSDAFAARLKEYRLPAGYHAALEGENENVKDIMQDLLFLIAVAVLLIFLIMVAQFQSFKSPVIVMFTIPLAFTGGLLALLWTKMDLSIVAMLGFLVLSGVVVNNGIVFIDCVNQLRIEGWEKREALVEAGRQRLRPILMTAMTTILGMSTMALGQGSGAEMMQPMAVVSIGGLAYATLMTLFVVPVMYDLFNGKNLKAREIQMIKESQGQGAPAGES